ncbi:DUF1826 domain-containing protein [Henriciella sp. AS95]|uniref:DUF1826 domain-containing protein n=1 Tax=Henriciella sp. AS95 TaxID=3135782 RepID=UPI003177F95D
MPVSSMAVDASQDPISACLCSGLAELVEVAGRDESELALWNRAISAQSAADFAALDLSHFEDIRLHGSGVTLLAELGQRLVSLQWPRNAVEQVLEDVRQIIDASACWPPRYTLRMECVSDDACREFHKDRTDMRIITTYRGPGTQWIDAASPDTEPLIHQFAPFSVGAFLGQRDDRRQRIFHRSPPIASSPVSRLVLVMDIERPGWKSCSLKGLV